MRVLGLFRIHRTKKPQGWTLDEIFADWWGEGDALVVFLILLGIGASFWLVDVLANW